MTDRAVPTLPSRSLDATAGFYTRLGFIEQYRERQAARHAEYRARVAAAQRTQDAQGTA